MSYVRIKGQVTSSCVYLFLFCLLLVFDHLLQFVIGSGVLCFQLLALDPEVTAKLLHLDAVAKTISLKK